MVNCVQGGKESGESRKVLDVWLEPKRIGGDLNKKESQVWGELCFGPLQCFSAFFFSFFFSVITLLRRRIKLDLSLVNKRH